MTIIGLDNTAHRYRYIPNRDYNAVGDRFLCNTYKALDHLHKTDALTITYEDDGELEKVDVVDVLTADRVNDIKIVYSEKKNFYSPSRNTVGFYDTHGIKFRKNHRKRWFEKNRGYNSPMAVLAHELIHCYNELYETKEYHLRKQNQNSRGKKIDQVGNDLSYPNKEEAFVIRMTNQVAKRLKEDIRSNYGRSYYAIADVRSVEKMNARGRRKVRDLFK